MLNPSDVYVSGGSNDLLVCWTDKVTKYDASSFYNWEQDNLPLHDLDERTHLLWEKFGHPTSALTGMSFVVSANATSSCSPLYFTTLSGCINALPEVINYPILVEVASFGDLGGLHISNKAFGPRGSLEIINRNSSFGSPYTNTLARAADAYQVDAGYTSYNLASSIRTLDAVAFVAEASNQNAPTVHGDLAAGRLLTTNTDGSEILISSGTLKYNDIRFKDHYVFTKKTEFGKSDRLTASLSSTTDPWDHAAAALSDVTSIAFNPFDKSYRSEELMDTYDVSTLNLLDDSEVAWGDSTVTGTPAAAFVYCNSLDFIRVDNCKGPIYIRNFNVDCQHGRDRGIEINNSKVNLERCSVSRANKAGLYASNSEVDLLRGFVAFRNYEIVDSARTGVPFAKKRFAYDVQDVYGAGIYAANSTINLRETYARDTEKAHEASGSSYYSDWAAGAGASGTKNVQAGNLYCMARNDIGIHAVNSNILGGRIESNGAAPTGYRYLDAAQLCSELNTEAGVKLENSVLDYSGRLFLDGNYFGLDSDNSKISVDTVAARYNQSIGLNLKESELIYGKDLYETYLKSLAQFQGPENYHQSQIFCIRNAQDIKCDNSNIKPLYTSSMPSIYQMVYTASSFGKEQKYEEGGLAGTTLLPSIEANNNSYLDLVHTHVDRTAVEDDLSNKTESTYGAMLRAYDNSKIVCRGSGDYANIFLGPTTRNKAHPLAAIYAGNQSNISLQGPTVVAQVGVDALADQNSVIDFGPTRDAENGLLVSSFDLSNTTANHTMVELHSTRACLVADQNSVLRMKDLGNYVGLYNDSPSVSARSDNYDYPISDSYQQCVSNGWMQLYPNGNLDDADVPNSITTLPAKGQAARYKFDTDTPPVNYRYLYTYGNLEATASGVTTGGMAVRAVGDSLVDVVNVHFPCGWANSSAIAYDFDGASPLPGPFCSRLHIWNIADQSLLKASYVSVSGVHPVDAPYHGPSGTWGAASGAPSSTPDTSSISILDYYGQNSHMPESISNLGKGSIQNVGPYRLYFSVDPAARFLRSLDNSYDGIMHQLFAQGYSFSGPASAFDNGDYGASANYTTLFRQGDGTQGYYPDQGMQPSGFYYPSEMISNPDTILASLDDSAANMFANAKHNSVDKSMIGKRVEVIYPTDGYAGDADKQSTYSKGLLSVNNFDLKKDN